jgi:hypothetical protein
MLEGIGVAGGKKAQMVREEAERRGEVDDFMWCLGRRCAGRALAGFGALLIWSKALAIWDGEQK